MSKYGQSRVLHAVEASRRAMTVLARPGAGRVHSVFHRCVNVTRSRGEWLTLCEAPFPRMPDGIVVEQLGEEDFLAMGIVPGAAVRIFEGGLSIPEADLAIEARHARVFDTKRARLDFAGNAAQLRRNLETARQTIIECGSEEGFGRMRDVLLGGGVRREVKPETLSEALCARGSTAIGALLDGLRCGDREAMRRGAVALMGLGVGMTPSGDDFLAGLAAALYVSDGYGEFFDVLRQLLNDGTRTTDLCELGHRRIADGEISDVLYEPMRLMVEGDEKAVREAVTALLKQGSSSGTEMALGVCLGMALEGARERCGAERSEFSLC